MDDIEIIDIGNKKERGSEISAPFKGSYLSSFSKDSYSFFERFIWLLFLFIYEETVFHIWAFDSITSTFLLKMFLCLPTAVIFSFASVYFKPLLNRIINDAITGIILLAYIVHILYHAIFKVFFSVEFIDKNNAKIYQYYREIILGIKENWIVLLLTVFVPVAILVIVNRFKLFAYRRISGKCFYIPIAVILLLVGIECLIVPLYGKSEFSPYDLMVNENNGDYSFEKIGVFASNEVQIRNLIFPRKVNILDDDVDVWTYSIPEPVINDVSSDISVNDVSGSDAEVIEEIIEVIDTSPNILNIDFVSLAENETNEDISALHTYFSTVEPTCKNEYTGLFKGFNLIFLTAEGFSNIAVDETHTPTLYRLTHEGFVFNNFYNPRTGGSTSDGEFVNSTSLYATNGGAKNFKIVGQNSMPFALGNIFNRTYEITSRAYHDNDFEYYGRDITYPGMGYFYTGVGNGLEIEKHWPESDLQMMEATIPEYINDDIFNIYYMTVSGHLNYNFTGNWCAKKHMEEVADLPYSEACKAYIACQMEFDRALEYLISQLEEKGIADRTVICFTGDHWPYGLTNEEFSELLGHKVEENFELYKSNLILWSEAIEEPIAVDKYCCSMDILPTLLNLFGMEYDSRLLMGRDILSDSEGFIGFLNKSIITDKFMYNAGTKETVFLTDEEVTEDEVLAKRKLLTKRMNVSSLIMANDYYKYICDELGIDIKTVEQNYTVDYSKFKP